VINWKTRWADCRAMVPSGARVHGALAGGQRTAA
jgi:hypothetical protein